jgi:hypothetical protein
LSTDRMDSPAITRPLFGEEDHQGYGAVALNAAMKDKEVFEEDLVKVKPLVSILNAKKLVFQVYHHPNPKAVSLLDLLHSFLKSESFVFLSTLLLSSVLVPTAL